MKCFNCHGYDHFQADFPNRKTLTIKEVEEIQALKKKISDEEFENKDHTLVTLDVGELLVIQRAIHVKQVPLKPSQREKPSTLGVQLEARCVSSSLMKEVIPIWLHYTYQQAPIINQGASYPLHS